MCDQMNTLRERLYDFQLWAMECQPSSCLKFAADKDLLSSPKQMASGNALTSFDYENSRRELISALRQLTMRSAALQSGSSLHWLGDHENLHKTVTIKAWN